MSTTLKPTLKSEEKYHVKLVDNPTTGFTWVYVCKNPETTKEVEREIVRTNVNLMGSPSTLVITFQSSKSDTIKFYHVRTWLHPKLADLEPDYVHNVTIEE